MNQSPTRDSARTRDALAPLALMLAIVAGVLLLYSQIAHAGTDPTPSLTGAGDTAATIWTTDGPAWLAIVIVNAALRLFLVKEHFLAQGRLLSGLTAGAGVLAAVVAWHFSGAPMEGIYTAIAVGLALMIHPAPVPVASAAARNAQAGKGTLAMLGFLAVLGMPVVVMVVLGSLQACTAAQLKNDAVTAEHDLVNCTGQAIGTTPALDLATLVAVANAVATERAKCTPAGGSLSWSCVETDLEGEGKVLGGCTFAKLLAGSPAAPPASTSGIAARMADDDPGRAALERFRAKVAGGATFHTAAGDI